MKNSILDKKLIIDESACVKCGRCKDICWNGALEIGENGIPYMGITKIEDEWHMCWECQRCMAGCPTGALSICGKNPHDSIERRLIPSAEQMEALIVNRRTCRDFRQKNVDKGLIEKILRTCGNSPTGSCNQLVEFTVIDDMDVMKQFTDTFSRELFQSMDKGVYPHRFTAEDMVHIRASYEKGESYLFRGAPHALFAHAPVGKGEWVYDTLIALTYAEMLMTANSLGTIYVSFARAALDICLQAKAFLGIPEHHYISLILGFGKPSFHFPRGVQRANQFMINRVG